VSNAIRYFKEFKVENLSFYYDIKMVNHHCKLVLFFTCSYYVLWIAP